MSQLLKANSTESVAGLGTFTFTTMVAGLHYISASATECPPSGLSIVLQQNGSQIAATPSNFPLQVPQMFVDAQAICAIGDTLSVVISSSAMEDMLLNTVKTLIRIERRS